MKKLNYLFITAGLLSTSLQGFAQNETSKTTASVPTPLPQPTKVTAFYGYSYRSFTGVNSNGPVVLNDGDMQMHILALKYNANEKWAFRVGSAYLIHALNFSMMKQPMTVNVEGFSDVRASTFYTFFKEKTQSLDMSLGLNLPTAPILKDDFGKPLPPQDQFSSGTYDLMAAVNYAYNLEDWSFVQKLDTVKHTGISPAKYRLGDDFGFTTAVSYTAYKYLTPTLSARFTDRKDLDVNNLEKPKSAKINYGSGWEGVLSLKSGMPLNKERNLMLGVEAGAPIFRTSKTNQYAVGQTLWYAMTNVTALF